MLTSPALLSMVSSRSASTRAISARSTGDIFPARQHRSAAKFQDSRCPTRSLELQAGIVARIARGGAWDRGRRRHARQLSAAGARTAGMPAAGAAAAGALAAAGAAAAGGEAAARPARGTASPWSSARSCAISVGAGARQRAAARRDRACARVHRDSPAARMSGDRCRAPRRRRSECTSVSSSWLKSPMAAMPAMRAPPLRVCNCRCSSATGCLVVAVAVPERSAKPARPRAARSPLRCRYWRSHDRIPRPVRLRGAGAGHASAGRMAEASGIARGTGDLASSSASSSRMRPSNAGCSAEKTGGLVDMRDDVLDGATASASRRQARIAQALAAVEYLAHVMIQAAR